MGFDFDRTGRSFLQKARAGAVDPSAKAVGSTERQSELPRAVLGGCCPEQDLCVWWPTEIRCPTRAAKSKVITHEENFP